MNATDPIACANVLFPAHEAGLPSPVTPPDVVIVSIPALTSFFLWIAYECTAKRASFTPNMVLSGSAIAVGCTAAQCLLVHRVFSIFECESTFASPMQWVAPAIAGVALLNLVVALVLARSRPRAAALVALSMAGACVAGEVVGRDVVPTSAVQILLPLQQLYGALVVTTLMSRRQQGGAPRPTPRLTPRLKAAPRAGAPQLKAIDPLQRRRGECGGADGAAVGVTSWWA